MIDIKQITQEMEKQKRCIIIYVIIFIFSFFSIITTCLKFRNIYINKNFEKTDSLKEQKVSILSNNTTITYFFKKKKQLIINGKSGKVKNNNLTTLHECFIITPQIRNKIYRGKTDIINLNNKNIISIPNKIYLINRDNGQYNYISAANVNIIFEKEIFSKKQFSVNDDDIFLSGDNFLFLTNENYLRINQKPHLKITTITNKKKEVYDIKSSIMELFFEKKYATFNKNVVFTSDDIVINSQFAKTYFNNKKKIKDIFISDKVNVKQKDKKIKSDFGYFDSNKNILILYKNISFFSNNNTSKGEFFVYDNSNKTSFSFNEETIFYKKKEQNYIYDILKKIAEELNDMEENYILNVIENNKKNNLYKKHLNDSENNNIIDRTKRIRTKLI